MEHSRRPRFKGKPAQGCQFCQEGKNPLCGDQITLFCRVMDGADESEPRVSLAFDGHGCSISQASASMLCDAVQDKKVNDARAILRHAEDVYTGRRPPVGEDDFAEDLEALAGVSKFPVRVKCAALPWKTFEVILDEKFEADGTRKPEAPLAGAFSTAGSSRPRWVGTAPLASLPGAEGRAPNEPRRLRVVSTED